MKHLEKLILVTLLSLSSAMQAMAQDSSNLGVGEEITLSALDGVVISAYWQVAKPLTDNSSKAESDDELKPTILLFHMAGSSALGEYSEIAPLFNAEGYNTLAVDLRSGGDRLGAPNKTASRLGDADIGYCDAYPDMIAALKWVKANAGGGPVVALGSSFSAGLVIKLGAENKQDIAGVLAFSPASGSPMTDCRPEEFLGEMTTPLIAFRPDREMAIESVITQAAAFRAAGIPYIEIANGRHGSLMLRESQTGTNMDHVWQPVLKFLRTILSAKANT